MAFSSLLFLCWFLPAFLALYFVAGRKWRNGVLLASSLFFYAWGAPWFLFVLIVPTYLEYLASRAIASSTDMRFRRRLLAATIAADLAILGYFKYSGFFIEQLNGLLAQIGAAPFDWVPVALPIGISFITFEKISYLVDVYNRRAEPAPSFANYVLFLALFPHLIAGPIFRYHDIGPQIADRSASLDDVCVGLLRFIIGLAKKVLIADQLAAVADKVFALPPGELAPLHAWLGVLAYTFQIYFDFSGYSDMAIGLGRMTGFRILENFNRPYLATSITDFWRRWHISLSSWMKEYLYIPLGGNRGSTARTYLNLWIVFLLSGLWHGASWTFVLWGAYQGLLLVAERAGLRELLERLPRGVARVWTFLLVMLGWVIFRSESLEAAIAMYGALAGFGVPAETLTAELVTNRAWLAFAIAAGLSFIPWKETDGPSETTEAEREARYFAFRSSAALVLLLLSLLSLVNSKFHPFIYFRF